MSEVTLENYVQLAMRTKCSMGAAATRMTGASVSSADTVRNVQFLHAVLGLVGEAGEMASIAEKHCFYGQEFDRVNAVEELGDLMWRIAEACDALGVSLKEVMQGNIDKLQVRYPDKFSETLALESSRDRVGERKAVERRLKAEDDGVFYEEGGAE